MIDKQAVLDSLQYISLPKSMTKTIGSFQFRPEIMLPVENGKEELSWEMIISGVLKIIAYSPEHEHLSYYREFIFAIEPDIVETLASVSIRKVEEKDWELAEEFFLMLNGLEPDNPRAILNLALMYDQCSEDYTKQGDSELEKIYEEKSFQCYVRALETGPELPETHLYAAYFFLRQRSFTRAKKEFTRFMDISKDEAKKKEVITILEQLAESSEREALFNEAFDFIRLGQEKKGLKKITALLKLHPELWNAWFLKGWALRRLGKFQDAYQAFSTALSRGGNSSDLLNELAICSMEIGRLDEAQSHLLKALKQAPADIKILSNLGIHSIKMKNLPAAEQYFQQVLNIDSKDKIALGYLEQINRQKSK